MSAFIDYLIMSALILLIYYLYREKQEEETFYVLKLIGYIVLGLFTFQFNQWMIPLGFIIYFFFMHPKLNKRQKQVAAYIGLALFFYHLLTPVIENFVFELPVKIPLQEENLYVGDFEKNWDALNKQFDFQDPKMHYFSFIYDKQGNLKQFDLQMVDKMNAQDKYINYRIIYHPKHHNFYIKRFVSESDWNYFEKVFGGRQFFESLDQMPLRNMHQHKFYQLEYEETFTNGFSGVNNPNVFVIEDGKLNKAEGEIQKGYLFFGQSSDTFSEKNFWFDDLLPERYILKMR